VRYHAHHLPAAFSALTTSGFALFHITDTTTVHGAGFADFGADFTGTVMKSRTAQHKIGRQLAHFGAVHHKPEVLLFNVTPAHFQAVIHRGLKADLGTTATGFYAGLHG
jgi:hypothetical protein